MKATTTTAMLNLEEDDTSRGEQQQNVIFPKERKSQFQKAAKKESFIFAAEFPPASFQTSGFCLAASAKSNQQERAPIWPLVLDQMQFYPPCDFIS